MILQFGSYKHPLGELGMTSTRTTLYDEADDPWAYEEAWTLNGAIHNPSASTSNMKKLVQKLLAAYVPGEERGKDLVLYDPDGLESAHAIKYADTLGGIRITEPVSFPLTGGAEHVTRRRFRVSMTATVPIDRREIAKIYYAFHETLDFEGGGPRFGHLEPVDTLPVKQRLKRFTIYKVRQQGRAVGLYATPFA
ncbi:MAG: hypothetical protein GY953_40495, partial [bacterium]|nr:hypothetical protein [bacterium]